MTDRRSTPAPRAPGAASWAARSIQLRIVIAYALLAGAFLLFCRFVIQYELAVERAALSWPTVARQSVRLFASDALILSSVTLAAALLTLARPRAGRGFMGVCAALLMLVGAANVRIVRLFLHPLNAGLIEYAGLHDLRSIPTLSGYMNTTDVVLLAAALGLAVSFAIVPWLLGTPALSGRRGSTVILGLGAGVLLAGPVLAVATTPERPRTNDNAVWSLLKSFALPPESRMPAVAHPSAEAVFATIEVADPPIPDRDKLVRSGIRNVLMVVMESVGSHYVDPVRKPELTPRMAALVPGAAYFPNTYPGVPSSYYSLISLANGTYPPVTGGAGSNLPNLFDELDKMGMQTGVFLAADWNYADARAFYAARRLDRLDIGSRGPCRVGSRVSPSPDPCKFAAAEDWIISSQAPFFAMIWTDVTHYPYSGGTSDPLSTFAMDRARYLDGVRETDRLIGRLVDRLRAQGRLDDTLLVIVGDHGEAFGQHGTRVHAADVYDETLRVPLLLVNERLFSGTTHSQPVRLFDVPTTIMALLGQPAPRGFQGVDLSGPRRPRRVFFASPWVSISMGYREGAMKYNFAVTSGEMQAFDLGANPREELSRQQSLTADEKRDVLGRLANWKGLVDSIYLGAPL